MATIETKYSVGDVVYHAGTTTETERHPCPDCNDTRKWSAVSPAGNEYSFGCPRCAASYSSHNGLSLKYTASVPSVSKLTIGSVQFNSATGSYDSGARYMCRETGVGSGQVYAEADFFASHEEALVAATAKAAKTNETTPYIVQSYNRSLEVSDYQLENGALKLAREATSRAGSMVWGLNDLFDTIKEASDKDAILEALEDYRDYSWERDLKTAAATIAEAAAERFRVSADNLADAA